MKKSYPRTLCHVSIGTNDLVSAKAFYQQLLSTLDIDMVCEYEHAVAFGKGYPEFWVQVPFDKQHASIGNGTHFGFAAASKTHVDNFYKQACALGARCNGRPGPRVEYGEPYYGCFVIDPEGHKIEASFWDFDYKKP